MILRPCPVGAATFDWIPEARMYVTEASSLPANLGRVYDDAVDEGLTLISRYDGSELVFVVHLTHYSNHGDREILYWTLIPAKEVAAVSRGAKPLCRIRIYND